MNKKFPTFLAGFCALLVLTSCNISNDRPGTQEVPQISIGENGNWFINGVDTGQTSKGEKGDPGEKGEQGEKGETGTNNDSTSTTSKIVKVEFVKHIDNKNDEYKIIFEDGTSQIITITRPEDETNDKHIVYLQNEDSQDIIDILVIDDGSTIDFKNSYEKEKQYYTFDGYYLNDRKWDFSKDIVTSDLVLKAHYIYDSELDPTNGAHDIMSSIDNIFIDLNKENNTFKLIETDGYTKNIKSGTFTFEKQVTYKFTFDDGKKLELKYYQNDNSYISPIFEVFGKSMNFVLNENNPEPLLHLEFKGNKNGINYSLKVYDFTNEVKLSAYRGNVLVADTKGTFRFDGKDKYTFTFNNIEYVSAFDYVSNNHVVILDITTIFNTPEFTDIGEVTLSVLDNDCPGIIGTPKNKFVKNSNFRCYFMLPSTTEDARHEFGLLTIKFGVNNFRIEGYTANEKQTLPEYNKEGTYTFKNNTFTLNLDGNVYTSKFNLVTSEYTIDIGNSNIFRYSPIIDNPTFTGVNPDFMGTGYSVSLFMYEDHTTFIDITTPMKSMNQMLDIRGTWAVDPETKNRVVSYQTRDQKDNTHDFQIPVVPKEGTNDIFTFDFVMVGADGPSTTRCEGKINEVFNLSGVKQMGPDIVNMKVSFTGKDTARIDLDSTLHMEGELTYTLTNNTITLVSPENKTFVSTFDEETGTYTINDYEYNYTQPFPGSFKTDLSYKLW